MRDGKPMRVTAVIADTAAELAGGPASIHKAFEGATLVDAPDASGALVRSIEPGSAAAQAGLRADDVIVGANRGRVGNLRELRERDADAAAFADLMAQARSRLARLYASGAPRVEMRARKAEVLAGLAGKMRALEQRRGVTYPLYEDWIAAGLNNARLASVSTYYGCLAGFRRVLAESGNDLARFYAAVRELSRLPRTERDARLCVALDQPAGS
ncbi:MAG: PDZ domain-containing protein [Gammaproteobacteria bacterium]|nr:MAG: PDZ domain-containing protein [Gammaproteobacteria bacterium]